MQRYSIISIPIIILLGAFQHFLYEWSGFSPFIALFAPVNESVWEHLKLAFWPSVTVAFAEFWLRKPEPVKFLFARAVGTLLMPVIICLGFYSYFALLQRPFFPLDLFLYFVAVISGLLLGDSLYSRPLPHPRATVYALAFLLLYAVALVRYTWNPPDHPFFREIPRNPKAAEMSAS
jgi:hypothetical protein